MNPFTYVAVTKQRQAIEALGADRNARFLAGGTNLIDDMKLGIESPQRLIDVSKLPLNKIETTKNGGVRIGATVRNSDLAYHKTIQENYRALSEALLSGASAQLRNMATTGGNLLQRTRCYYFRDISYPCNKRQPDSGCSAIDGFNRIHAVLGTSEKCIATHPSDMCVAMAAFDAMIHTVGPRGERLIPINDFYISYGDDPAKENILEHGELITAVELPPAPKKSHYLKVRDRASYEFALASAAVVLDIKGGTIRSAQIALGGVATKPWRATEAEKSLAGKKAAEQTFQRAADLALQNAKPQAFNGFKIDLAKRAITQALLNVSTA